MTKISKKAAYPKKTPIVKDYFVGTDSENFGKTVSFGFEETAGLINKLNGTPILNYLFDTNPNIGVTVLTEGKFLSENAELGTSELTKLYVNKFNNYGENLSELYQFLKTNATDFYLKLRNSNNQNNAVYFNISSIDDLSDYFVFNIEIFKENEFLPALENLNIYFFDFELKATASGTSDPLKLDKGGYVGTAKNIDDRILVLENQTDIDNAFIVKPTFALAANILTINALGKWKLEGVIYENLTNVTFPIAYCATGKTRLDYFVPNNTNGFTKISGLETLGVAIAPQLPNEGLYVTYILVSDSGVGEPVTPPSVVIPNLHQVLGSGFSTTRFIWFFNNINSLCTRFASDHILFQKLESVFNFIRADNTTQSYNVQLPNKIGGAEQTFAMVSDLTKSNIGLSNVDNTSDATKPVSVPQQTALDLKLDIADYNEFVLTEDNVGEFMNLGLPTKLTPSSNDTLLARDYLTNKAVEIEVGKFQEKLVSATNIKTVNGTSILGSGDVIISSGASTTDALPEGSTNLYWTVARFLANLTAANIKSALGITTLSGSNTGDQDLSTLAPKASPALTGIPTAPTASVGTNTTQVATTAFVLENQLKTDTISIAMSDTSTALATGDTDPFQAPYDFTLVSYWIGVKTAPTVSSLIVDVKKNGTSITSTKAGIDATEKTSLTGTSPVLTTTSFTKGDEITPNIYQVGSSETGRSLKLYLEIIKT